MSEPRTAVGRKMLAALDPRHGTDPLAWGPLSPATQAGLDGWRDTILAIEDEARAAAESQREALDVGRLPGALARVLNPYLDEHPLPVHPASHRQWKRLADELVVALKERSR